MADTNTNLLIVNGTPIKCPSSYQYIRSSLDDADSTYRDANGKLQRCVIRDDIIKIQLSWNSANMDAQAVSTLIKAVDDPFFTVQYFDPYDGKMMTRQFYCGDKTLEMYSFIDGKPVWSNVSFNLISQ